MDLAFTKRVLEEGFGRNDARSSLIMVLLSAIECLSLPGNDFLWSSWQNADEAVAAVEGLVEEIRSGRDPGKTRLGVLFAPTGELQEVAVGSGWGDVFLKLAEKYDEAAKRYWSSG